jgi:phosphatidate cytidylyltransferase
VIRARILNSAIIISALALLVWLDIRLGTAAENGGIAKPGLMLLACLAILGPLAAMETLRFDPATRARRIRALAVILGTGTIILSSAIPLLFENYPADCPFGRTGWLAFGTAAAVGIAFASQMLSYQREQKVTDDLGRTVLVVVYVGLLLGFWMPIRGQVDNEWGMVALLSLFVTVKMSDSFAWAFGNLFGKHKLSPVISPGKTIEGFAGGIAGGVAGAIVVFQWIGPAITGESSDVSWIVLVLFGIAVSLAGVFGDLAESMLKRDGGVKNSSNWLPGLGGVMDLFDSLLAAGPVVLAFWNSGLLVNSVSS